MKYEEIKMDKDEVRKLLQQVADGTASVDDAMLRIKEEPLQSYRDMGFARPDLHRGVRQGVPEVIYGAGKTPQQIADIAAALLESGQKTVLITRMSREAAELAGGSLRERFGLIAAGTEDSGQWSADAFGRDVFAYDELSGIGIAGKMPQLSDVGNIVVATAGTSDMPVAEEAAKTAETLGNRVTRLYDVGVAGIHRLMSQIDVIMSAKVIIAIAGMEGALASVIGGMADCPVIAVPTSVGYGASFNGLAALLSMLNSCASGVSVVNIDNGFGAGYLASMINKIGVD